MPQCNVCHQDRAPGREVRVYTARVVPQTRNQQREPGELDEGRSDTQYGDFEEHQYYVCNRCRSRWDWGIVPASVGLSIVATLACASAALRRDIDWLFAVAIVVLIGGLVGAGTFTTGEQLKRTARRHRGRGTSAKAFSEQEYRAMMHMG